MNFIIECLTFIVIFLYNKLLIDYCINLLHVKNKKLVKLFPFIISIFFMIIISLEVYAPQIYILMFYMYIFTFKTIFSDSIFDICSIHLYQIFNIILFKDIATGILSILSRKNVIQNMLNYEIHIVSFGICELLMIILIINFNKFCRVNVAKKLIIDKKNIIINKLIVISLIIILINFNYTDFGNTAYRILINRICIGFCFYFALFMRMESIRWVEEEIFYKSNLLNLEYNENINKKIDEYSNLLRMYNHDFKNILGNIKDSIEIGDSVKAKEIIYEFDGKIHSLKNYNKKFSNNSLINALLNRLSKECEDKDISFDFDCYIPDDIVITELDLLNIFNNLSSNAYEACSKQYCNEKRWIILKSYVKDKNFIIYQANSFNGEIKYKKDRLITTKENKRSHGIGVESIKHIVNEANGMALVKVDKEKREFKFLIKIPDYE